MAFEVKEKASESRLRRVEEVGLYNSSCISLKKVPKNFFLGGQSDNSCFIFVISMTH